ncbi:MAG: heat-inducible transcriptional repressor HrcA [Rothia sp. (in: high G+C Gram-positive bacteria)]|nr:heat-inducible transcriptional repressor HrcA [Rothia sp. (in: high G+C Gram-positive bacteria)]
MDHPRRLQVLQAIVQEYVQSREPVGSKTLLQRYQLGVSSATIRNDMAALEDAGYILAPHASAGRVPTHLGYRVFVDHMTSLTPLSLPERQAIDSLLERAQSQDEALQASARLLASLTHQVALIQLPARPQSLICHLDLVSLSAESLLLVLVTEGGDLYQARVQAHCQDDELADLTLSLRQLYLNKPLDQLAQAGANRLFPASLGQLEGAISALGRQGQERQLLIAGTSYLAEATPDFSGSIGPILQALEEQDQLVNLLADLPPAEGGYRVMIGAEHKDIALAETSLVASSYGPGERAYLGVVGPTRMDYPATVAKVKALAGHLSSFLGQT